MPYIQLQFRRGTALEWSTVNPTLADGELGIETDTLKHKIGDGSTEWNDLGYASLALNNGTTTGDIVRWNNDAGVWESASEPLEFNQIILTPAETAALNQEGSLFYCSTDKAVHVCTSDE